MQYGVTHVGNSALSQLTTASTPLVRGAFKAAQGSELQLTSTLVQLQRPAAFLKPRLMLCKHWLLNLLPTLGRSIPRSQVLAGYMAAAIV